MAKNPAPFNGPSKTGNPSGGGRGNNPSWDDEDDALSVGGGYAYRYRASPSYVASAPSSAGYVSHRELAKLTEVVDETVEIIRKGTFSGLIRDLQQLAIAYAKPGSPERQGLTPHSIEKHIKAARRAIHTVQDGRLDNFARLIRKAREELSAPAAEEVLAAVRRALTPHERGLVALLAEGTESPISHRIRSRVTIEQLRTYLGV